jgi:diadenosine tetraphosphatase ApaH/serine/threonine PP2A family protein phosphatase
LLSDIHANREALTACLAHADRLGAERFGFLGDLVGYGADPGWVVDAVRERMAAGGFCVMGNHDEAMVQPIRPSLNAEARTVLQWTRERLSDAQRAFIASLPYAVEDDDCLFVHANGFDPKGWAYLEGAMEVGRSLHATAASYTFCGHVHEPMLYHMGLNRRVEAFAPGDGSDIPVSGRRRWLTLVGSVGQPRDGMPAAAYVMFDRLHRLLTFHRVPYDVNAAASKVRAAGLPERLAWRLQEGT